VPFASLAAQDFTIPNGTTSPPIVVNSGTKGTVDNYARDVSAYLMWAAEPKLEERHLFGASVMVYLIAFAVIMFLAKRAVWGRLHNEGTHTA